MASVAFSGGDKLQAALAEIQSRMANAGSAPRVSIGLMSDAKYPDGKSIAEVAAYNEFGTKTSPPRPFFRNMIKQNGPTWGKSMAALLVNTDFSASKTLGQMGLLIEGQLVQSIRDLTSPPLAPSTVRRKGFDKPLIDTGFMWKSVTSRVEGL